MLTLADGLSSYIPIGILVLMAVLFGIANLIISNIMGPRHDGAQKGITYESGVNPIGTARKRFNVRFYMVAMMFLLFDVEIIFLYPWAVTFTQLEPRSPESALFLGRILFFIAASAVGYIYAFRKGVFRFD